MLDMSQQLGWRRDRCLGKTVEQSQDLGAASQLTKAELSRYPRMREDDRARAVRRDGRRRR
jgi:hypothetical protein